MKIYKAWIQKYRLRDLEAGGLTSVEIQIDYPYNRSQDYRKIVMIVEPESEQKPTPRQKTQKYTSKVIDLLHQGYLSHTREDNPAISPNSYDVFKGLLLSDCMSKADLELYLRYVR